MDALAKTSLKSKQRDLSPSFGKESERRLSSESDNSITDTAADLNVSEEVSSSYQDRTTTLSADEVSQSETSFLIDNHLKNVEQLERHTFEDDSGHAAVNLSTQSTCSLSFSHLVFDQPEDSLGETKTFEGEDVDVEDCLNKVAELEQDDNSNQSGVLVHDLQEEVNCSASRGLNLILGSEGEVDGQQDLNVTVNVDSHFKDLASLIEQGCVDAKMTADSLNEQLELSRDSSIILPDASEELLDGVLGTGTTGLGMSSTPMKQAPPPVPLPYMSPIRNDETHESTDITDTSSDSSGSEEAIDSSLEWDEEDSDGDIPISESFLGAFLNHSGGVTLDQSGAAENRSIDEQEGAFNLTTAGLYNDLKIHDYSNMSVNECLLQIMELYVKNKLSKAGLERLVKSVCSFLPEDHNVPYSSLLILNYVKMLAPPVPAIVYYYCESCLFYHGRDNLGVCQVCNETKFGRFFWFDIDALIKFSFENRNLASIMDSNASNPSDVTAVSSVKDGSVYKLLNANKKRYDVNAIFGSDGVRIRKGSTKELWLAMFTIAELPIHFQASFLTVVGVWYGQKKPDMKTFLKPFAEKMETLDQGNESGVEWTHPVTKEVHKSSVRLLVNVLDAPARAMVQNVMHYNSRFGCNICETKAQLTPRVPGLKRLRVYYYKHNPKLRTKERMLKQAEEVGNKKHVKGVRGPSALSIIPSVDISQSIVPEYLHSVLLGVTKQLLVCWTTKPGDWSLKDQIPEIDAFLKTFKHPNFVHRSQRQLKTLKCWKASDFYYFLLFESLPTLQGRLPDKYLQHFMLLVKGIFTLLKTSITEAEIDEADSLLKLFVNEFGGLYGCRQLTSNVHQLIHMGLCVRRFGPLHCFSAFSMEGLNGLIAKATHGTNQVDDEIVHNIKICQGINILQNIVRGYGGLSEVVSNAFSQGEFLGKKVSTFLSPEEFGILQDGDPTIFARAKLGYDVFTSEMYKILTSEDYYVMYEENSLTMYGSIKYFAQTKDDNFVVLRRLTVDHTQVFYHRESRKCIEQLIPVKSSENYVAIRFSHIVTSIVKVGKIGCFIYKRPNLYRYVM